MALPDPGTSPREKKLGFSFFLHLLEAWELLFPLPPGMAPATTTSSLGTEGGSCGVTCRSHLRCQCCSQDLGSPKEGLLLLDSSSHLSTGVSSRKDGSFITSPPHGDLSLEIQE